MYTANEMSLERLKASGNVSLLRSGFNAELVITLISINGAD
jgi:hypothetical protein